MCDILYIIINYHYCVLVLVFGEKCDPCRYTNYPIHVPVSV
jgi:hypothetical protein